MALLPRRLLDDTTDTDVRLPFTMQRFVSCFPTETAGLFGDALGLLPLVAIADDGEEIFPPRYTESDASGSEDDGEGEGRGRQRIRISRATPPHSHRALYEVSRAACAAALLRDNRLADHPMGQSHSLRKHQACVLGILSMTVPCAESLRGQLARFVVEALDHIDLPEVDPGMGPLQHVVSLSVLIEQFTSRFEAADPVADGKASRWVCEQLTPCAPFLIPHVCEGVAPGIRAWMSRRSTSLPFDVDFIVRVAEGYRWRLLDSLVKQELRVFVERSLTDFARRLRALSRTFPERSDAQEAVLSLGMAMTGLGAAQEQCGGRSIDRLPETFTGCFSLDALSRHLRLFQDIRRSPSTPICLRALPTLLCFWDLVLSSMESLRRGGALGGQTP